MPGITFTSGGGTSEVGYVTLKSLGAANAVQLTTSKTMTPIDDYPYRVPVEAMKQMVVPSPSYFPSPAVCVQAPCDHHGACPVIWIKQDFLLRPNLYSPYWELDRTKDGSFIVKSSHPNGDVEPIFNRTEYRTFIWRVGKDTSLLNPAIPDGDFWIAKWAD